MFVEVDQFGREPGDIVAVDVSIGKMGIHVDAGGKIIHVIEGPEAHGEEVAEVAMVGLEVEAGEFHGFGEPSDAGVELLYLQAAAFPGTEQEMGGKGIAVEPQVGKAGIDGGEIYMIPVEIF